MHPLIKVGAILKNKKGETVEIVKTNIINSNYPVLGLVNNNRAEFYTSNGRKLLSTKTNSDLNLDLPPVFDPTKPVQTRDERPARIIYIGKNKRNNKTIIALITSNDETEYWETYFENGQYLEDEEDSLDPINIPE